MCFRFAALSSIGVVKEPRVRDCELQQKSIAQHSVHASTGGLGGNESFQSCSNFPRLEYWVEREREMNLFWLLGQYSLTTCALGQRT